MDWGASVRRAAMRGQRVILRAAMETPRRGLVSTLGIAQIISWGTLFYAIGVLGRPMRDELGTSELFLFGSFTCGLLVSAALAPLAGRLVDRLGGRVVLSAGSLFAVAAMLLLAFARHPAMMALGWLVAGAAMAACLYDPAFATLAQHTGDRYRRSVAILTLYGGFASTVFWPLSQVLLDAIGWREAFMVYAAMHLLVCLPIHAALVPRLERSHDSAARSPMAQLDPASRARLLWLGAGLALATFVVGVMAVHVISLLASGGLTPEQAVLVSTLFGPVQVAGRLIEMSLARHVTAVTTGYASFVLIVVALVALIGVNGFGAAAFVFIAAYGIGNGVLTIVRGTAPAQLFGNAGLGGVLGYLSRATLFARAVAPACFSGLLTLGLTRNQALASLAAAAIMGVACYAVAVRGR
jgi:MFS family permease